MQSIQLDALDFAALMCSRVCHDVINPVGAIQNGLEVLADDKDQSMREFALELIDKSARQASARLKFARIAFGASGSAGASLDMGDARQAAMDLMNDEKTKLEWDLPRVILPKNKIKLLLNLLLVAQQAIPRGGQIEARGSIDGEVCRYTISARGPLARIPPHAAELIRGQSENGALDTHAIQTFHAGMIARAAGMNVELSIADDTVTIDAAPA